MKRFVVLCVLFFLTAGCVSLARVRNPRKEGTWFIIKEPSVGRKEIEPPYVPVQDRNFHARPVIMCLEAEEAQCA